MTLADAGLATIRLDGRLIEYRVRTNARSRGIRVTIDPRKGLVVSVPPASRRGWARPDPRVEGFLQERRAWVLRHLDGLARDRERVRALGGTRDGSLVLYRGEPHRLRIVEGAVRGRRSTVERSGGDAEDELVVGLASGDRRPLERILGDWFRERATDAIDAAIALHAPSLGVRPAKVDIRDPRSRWGSASRTGRLMFSWRLVLAPPAALETVVVHELAHLRVFGHGAGFWKLVAGRRPAHAADRTWLRRNSHALHGMLAREEARPLESRPE
ncbi:MAG TPA: SprT family zinc-dependent metalloprotease [Candidatus Limnocylindrales bacterium]|nr:SprT family zinc-dependent metalloprotease [Candidatus Limnocylindrales bacterium]